MTRGRNLPASGDARTSGGQILLRVLEQQRITLTEFAALAGLSTSTLSRGIRAEPGHHTVQFASTVRTAASQRLLVDLPLESWVQAPLSAAKLASLFPIRRKKTPRNGDSPPLGTFGAQRLLAFLRGTRTTLEVFSQGLCLPLEQVEGLLAAAPGTQPVRFVHQIYVQTGTHVAHANWLQEPVLKVADYPPR